MIYVFLPSNGNLFHSFGPAIEYALSPYVCRLATGSSSIVTNWLFKDLNTRPEFLLVSRAFFCS